MVGMDDFVYIFCDCGIGVYYGRRIGVECWSVVGVVYRVYEERGWCGTLNKILKKRIPA